MILTYGMCPYIDLHIIPAYQMQIWVMTCNKTILASDTIIVIDLSPRSLFLFQILFTERLQSMCAELMMIYTFWFSDISYTFEEV